MSNDDSTRIAQVVEKVPWGDIENSVQAIDAWISRLEFVLAAQFKELDSYEGWPAWLDGRVSTEESVDPAGLNYADTLLLVAALVHDVKITWRSDFGLTDPANLLEALLEAVPRAGRVGRPPA